MLNEKDFRLYQLRRTELERAARKERLARQLRPARRQPRPANRRAMARIWSLFL